MAQNKLPVTSSFIFGGMDETGDSVDVGVAGESDHVQERTYTGCVEVINCDIDTDLNALSRDGYTKLVLTNGDVVVNSAWSNVNQTFCVLDDGFLYKLEGNTLTQISSVYLNFVVEFVQVNDVVVFTDYNVIGIIDQTYNVTMIASPNESIDIQDLKSWVLAHATTDPSQPFGNIEVNPYNITTFAGRCLCYFNGMLYLSIDNFVYCTKAMNLEQMDVRYNIVGGFDDTITMIKAVTDGLYIGTNKSTFFLAGSKVASHDESMMSVNRGFTQRKLLPFGPYYGADIYLPADNVGVIKATDMGILFVCSDGIYVGISGGVCTDLTNNRIQIPDRNFCTSLVRLHGKTWQYIVCIGTETIVVNLVNGLHSLFTNYTFNNFYRATDSDSSLANYFGVSSTGIYQLIGSTDDGAVIQAYVTTPTVDFGVPKRKNCSDEYIHARTTGALFVDIIVDETITFTNIPFGAPNNVLNTVRRLRAKLPKGVRGTNWQFKIHNGTLNSSFSLFSLTVSPVESLRSI